MSSLRDHLPPRPTSEFSTTAPTSPPASPTTGNRIVLDNQGRLVSQRGDQPVKRNQVVLDEIASNGMFGIAYVDREQLAEVHHGSSMVPGTACVFDDGDVLHLFIGEPPESWTGRRVPAFFVPAHTTCDRIDWDAVLQCCPRPVPPHCVVVLVDARHTATADVLWMNGAQRTACKVHGFPTRDEVFVRAELLAPGASLKDARVAVIGTGSGGSMVADLLAKSGIDHLTLVDCERMEPANLSRHVLDARSLGRSKSVALAEELRCRNPGLIVEAHTFDIRLHPERLTALVAECDAVAACTDSNPSRSVLDEIARTTGVPAYFGRVYHGGCGGDVLTVRPGGPCLACMIGAEPDDAEQGDFVQARAEAPCYLSDEDVRAGLNAALACDITPIAQMMVKMILAQLIDTPPQRALREELSAPMHLLANRRERRFGTFGSLHDGIATLSIMRWYGVRIDRDATCPVCAEHDRHLTPASPPVLTTAALVA